MSEPFKRWIDFTNIDMDTIKEIEFETSSARISAMRTSLYVSIDKPGGVNIDLWIRLFGNETPPFLLSHEQAKKIAPREVIDWYNKIIQDYFKQALAEFEKEKEE